MSKQQTISAAEMKIGDIVEFETSVIEGYEHGTVYKVTETEVHILRPYVILNTTTINPAVASIGFEDYSVPLTHRATFRLIRRPPA